MYIDLYVMQIETSLMYISPSKFRLYRLLIGYAGASSFIKFLICNLRVIWQWRRLCPKHEISNGWHQNLYYTISKHQAQKAYPAVQSYLHIFLTINMLLMCTTSESWKPFPTNIYTYMYISLVQITMKKNHMTHNISLFNTSQLIL